MKQDWNQVFESAFKWPQLRVLHWKTFHKISPSTSAGTKMGFRKIAQQLHAYRLSDDLVWAVTQLSVEIEPAVLMEHAMAARMPFPLTLFEWDAEARSTSYKQINVAVNDPSDASNESPAMLVSSAGRALKIITDFSYKADERTLCIFPLSYWFDPERESEHVIPYIAERYISEDGQKTRISGGDYMNKPETMSKRPDFSRKAHWWLTTAVIQKHEDQARAIENDDRMGCYMQGPIAAMALNLNAQEADAGKAHQAIVGGTAGNPRWFGALCFLLNQQRTVRYVQAMQSPEAPESKASASPAEAHYITLFLPREKVVSNLVRLASSGPRKRMGEHDVAGFWSISHKRGRPDCDHKWPTDHTRRQVCSECGALRWWKSDFKRGHGPTLKKGERRLDYGGQDIARLVPAKA